jgi:signal transduction histidine kinase
VRLLPENSGPCTAAALNHLYLLLDADGTVLESSSAQCQPVGHPVADLPAGRDASTGTGGIASGIGSGVGDDRVAWAFAPIVQAPPGSLDAAAAGTTADLARIPGAHPVATLYEQRSVTTGVGAVRLGNIRPLLTPGLVVLGGAVPVGLLFGYVSMRRPVRRLHRLATTTQALADGDLDRRVRVTGRDELSHLEADVNRMAERLSASLIRERALADTRARTTERARIARDLHDSVSQDLFSLRLLASGIARALPDESPLRTQLRQLETTATTATHEMQAMLLQLRPTAPADHGLPTALRQLAEAYRQRVGIVVHTELDDVELAPHREHALLRIAQEALANAVRHGEPTEVTLTLTGEVLGIHDNGRGFDPDAPTFGMGLTLMRERAAEVDSLLTVVSSPTTGTTVEVRRISSPITGTAVEVHRK